MNRERGIIVFMWIPIFLGAYLGARLPGWLAEQEDAEPCSARAFYQAQAQTTLEEMAAIQKAFRAKYGYFNNIVPPSVDPADSTCACPNNTPYTYESQSSPFAFMMRATGNLDEDDEVDTWTITSASEKVVHMSED